MVYVQFQKIKISEELIIKYKVANDQVIEPRKATIDPAGHDILAAEDKILQPGLCTTVSLEINMEIPKGSFGKIYPRSGLLVNNFVSCDRDVIDSVYHGIDKAIMTNHSEVPYEISIGQGIAQLIFHKVEQVSFIKADTFTKTER